MLGSVTHALTCPTRRLYSMSESAWYAIRLNVVLLVAVMRILLLRPYIQSFLTYVVAPHHASALHTPPLSQGCIDEG